MNDNPVFLPPPGFKYRTQMKDGKYVLILVPENDLATSWRLNVEDLKSLYEIQRDICQDKDIRFVETTGNIYYFDTGNSNPDDGLNVLKPLDGGNFGRWLLMPGGGGGMGPRGYSVLYGVGVPAPALGIDGDSYLNTSNSDWYGKAGGAWILQTNISGAPGVPGAPGAGVPVGGTAGQLLAKNTATNYDCAWIAAPAAANGLPVGGAINQLLSKNSATNYDCGWIAAPAAANGLPVGGAANQILAKNTATNYDCVWYTQVGLNPIGGTVGQVLTKNSATNYDYGWSAAPAAANGLPIGGTANQLLAKNTATNYDCVWYTQVGLAPVGGTVGQILTKNSATNYDYGWSAAPAAANGLPVGGTANQHLVKNSATNYDCVWYTQVGMNPVGGTAGQILRKNTATNYDYSWTSNGLVPAGGTANQVLAKTTATDYDVAWATPSAGGGSAMLYNTVARYQVELTASITAWILSSAPVQTGLSWTRVTTTLTINHVGHGRSAGDRVILRNMNESYYVALIASIVDVDNFTVTCNNAGAASGTAGAYSLGFTFAHNAGVGSITSGTITAPAGGNVQLISMRMHLAASTRGATTYDLIVPASATNGAGANTGNDDVYVPMYSVRQDADALSAVGATIAKNVAANFSRFQMAALPAVATGIIVEWNF